MSDRVWRRWWIAVTATILARVPIAILLVSLMLMGCDVPVFVW